MSCSPSARGQLMWSNYSNRSSITAGMATLVASGRLLWEESWRAGEEV